MDTDEQLYEFFYGEDLQGLASAKELKDYAKTKGVSITLKQAQDFLSKQEAVQRFQERAKSPYYVPITGQEYSYQCDLLFIVAGEKNTENLTDEQCRKRGTPILVVIDITTRKLYARILKNKQASTTANAMREIITEIRNAGQDIKSMEHDDGGEFKAEFEDLLVQEGISELVYPRTPSKHTALAKVERVNGTIRRMYEKRYAVSKGNMQTIIPEVVKRYNNRIHRSTGYKPNEALYNPIHAKEERKAIRPRKLIRQDYHVGDRVRIMEEFDIFTKKAQPVWSKDIYTIAERDGYSFLVEDSDGDYLEANLGKERVPRRFRAWEMLKVQAEPVAPPQPTNPTERKTRTELKQENFLDKALKEIENFNTAPEEDKRPVKEIVFKKKSKARTPKEDTPKETISAVPQKIDKHYFTKDKELRLHTQYYNPMTNKKVWEFVPLEYLVIGKNRKTKKPVYHPVAEAYLQKKNLNQ